MICKKTSSTRAARNSTVPARYPQFNVMVTESPPVSPSVVAAILMIQKPSVTSGTLLRPIVALSIVSHACCKAEARLARSPESDLLEGSKGNPSSLQDAYVIGAQTV